MSDLDFSNAGGADIKMGGESGTCGGCADLQAQVKRLTEERDKAKSHGCQDCAYEVGVAVPGPTGLCPKHANEQIDGRHSERHRRVESERQRDEANRQLAAVVGALRPFKGLVDRPEGLDHVTTAHLRAVDAALADLPAKESVE